MAMGRAGRCLAGLWALAALSSCSLFQGTPTWESETESGLSAFEDKEYDEAERHLAAALEFARGFGPTDPRLSKSVNNLADVYVAQERGDDAEKLRKDSGPAALLIGGRDHPNVAETLHRLGSIYL